jgi:hypothetical protein
VVAHYCSGHHTCDPFALPRYGGRPRTAEWKGQTVT